MDRSADGRFPASYFLAARTPNVKHSANSLFRKSTSCWSDSVCGFGFDGMLIFAFLGYEACGSRTVQVEVICFTPILFGDSNAS